MGKKVDHRTAPRTRSEAQGPKEQKVLKSLVGLPLFLGFISLYF